MRKLLNSSLAIIALALALLVSGKTTWAATTLNGSDVTGQTIKMGDINSVKSQTYTTTVTTGLSNYYEHIPIQIPAEGMLRVDVTNTDVAYGVDVWLYDNLGQAVSNSNSDYAVEAGGNYDWLHFYVKKGTYILQVKTSPYLSVNVPQVIKFTPEFYPATNTLKSGKTIKGASISESDQYYKLVVSSPSLVKVELKEMDKTGASTLINLCNKNKKVYNVNIDRVTDNKAVYFAVKKGTYHISVQAPYASDNQGYNTYPGFRRYSLKTTVKKYTDAAGTKKKPKTIANKKTVNGMIAAGDKSTDYFQFTLKKKAKVTVETKSQISAGRILFTLTAKNTKKVSGNIPWNLTPSRKSYKLPIRLRNSAKLPAGTYIIAVKAQDTGSNGTYSIKVKY